MNDKNLIGLNIIKIIAFINAGKVLNRLDCAN